jgi:hypothetical protein
MLALFERWILEALQRHFNAKPYWYYQFILIAALSYLYENKKNVRCCLS